MKMLVVIATAVPMVVAGSAALARGFTGNWPLAVSHSQRANGNYCLKLNDDGGYGWKHSGEGSNAGLVFTAAERNGAFGKGITVTVYDGEEIDSGVVTFGAKGGC